MTWTSEPGSSDLATRAELWRAERVRGPEEECQVLDPPHQWCCSTWAASFQVPKGWLVIMPPLAAMDQVDARRNSRKSEMAPIW
jgi:hypothetical protein